VFEFQLQVFAKFVNRNERVGLFAAGFAYAAQELAAVGIATSGNGAHIGGINEEADKFFF